MKEEKKEVEEVKEEKKEVEEVKEEEKKVAMEETTHENVNAAAEEESDDSSYTYESYYSYETVSEEESMEPSMPSLVSAPDMEVLEEKGLTPREEEAWEVEKSEENATSVDSKKEEEWGFEDEKEKPEEKEEPVKEEKEEEWGFDEEEKTDAKKEEEDWGFDDKEEEKVAEKKHEDDDWGFDDEKEKVEKEEPVEEKKEEDWRFEEEKEEKPVKEEKVVEKEEDDWGFEEETEKPTEKKEEKPEEEEKKEPVKEKPTEEKPAEQKPVEEKEQAASPKKEEVKPAEEKKEEKEIKPEASEKTEGSLATALARTEKKLEVDEHLWDDDDEPVKATRTTRRGRKKEKAQTERVVIETPLRSEKLFSDEEEEEERMAKKKARRGRMGRSKKLATFEASWEEEEKPVEKKEPVKEEKPVEKEEKVVEKEPVKEEPVKEKKEEEWGFDEEEKPEEKEEWGFSEEEKKEDDWSFEDEKKPEEEKKKEEAPVKEKPEEKKEKEEKKPVEEAKPVETEKKPEEEDWGFDDEKEEEPEEKHEEKEEKDAKEEKPVKEEKKEKEEDWGFDEKENATVEKEEPTEKAPAEEKKAPAEEKKAPAEEKKAPAEEQKPSTQTHFTSPSMEVVRTTILTPSTLLLQACRVLDALLSTPVLLAQTCDCFKSYIPAVIADLPLTCYFVEKLVRKVAEKEWKEEDLNAMIEIVTILAAENESVLRSASDLDLELFLEFQKKEDVSSIPKQLVLLLLSFYQTHQQSWLIPIFIHIFTSALSHHTVLQVTRGLQYAVTVLQKLKNEDAQFVIATCGMTIIEAILDVCAVLDKEGLSAMVSFTALLYGKTDKKNEIVELVLHLCAISLKRSLELQPLNVKKCDEDVELVKLNSMIGELLFVMARVNPDSFKQGLQSLPAEKSEMLQNQLRRTVQVKQSESNAARRRNATRMPVKLDASKFTSE